MCDKSVDDYSDTLKFLPDCYITQKNCDKAVNIYHFTIQFVRDSYKTQEIRDHAVNKFFLAFIYIPDRYKAQKICDRVISKDPFMLVYCPEKYKIQRMCDKTVNNCLEVLKFIRDWFVTIKMIKRFLTALYADDDIFYFNEDSGDVIFFCNERGILSIDLNNINLDDTNYNKHDPETIIHVRILAWNIKSEKRKALKKELNEETMLIAWRLR